MAMTDKITRATEEYLEAIYRLEKKAGLAKTSELVNMLKVSPGSITNTVERLEKESLIVHKPYKGVKLTKKGRRVALNILRKHRLSERLLTDVLNVEWDKAHYEACKLEHGISVEIAEKIDKALGHPKTCPHGNPIPTEKGKIIEEETLSLNKLNLKEKGIIRKINEDEPKILNYLNYLNLKPKEKIEVLQKAPFNGPITIKKDGKIHALSWKIAEKIHVKKIII
jgi:DtxR family Mn-dependent transcriptional regulator